MICVHGRELGDDTNRPYCRAVGLVKLLNRFNNNIIIAMSDMGDVGHIDGLDGLDGLGVIGVIANHSEYCKYFIYIGCGSECGEGSSHERDFARTTSSSTR